MRRIKETYLLFLIVIGLISLGLYSTYALFTASTTINDVVGFNATLTTDSNILEYEMVTVPAGETKIIELNITNSYESSLYYGAWYEVVSPSDASSISAGIYTAEDDTPGSGQIAANTTLSILVGIKNNGTTEATVNIGTVASLTSNLGLVEPRALLPSGWGNEILVTDEYLEENLVIEEQVYEYTIPEMTQVTLEAGEYLLEVWGAQGGGYSTSSTGGLGGYSYGTLTLTEDTNTYVYVGGQGSNSTTSGSFTAGGFNGGGAAGYRYGGSGGGASDIRVGTDSLYARVIVAGGGGGGWGYSGYKGGAGGGTTGGQGIGYSADVLATGGTQTSGGVGGFEDGSEYYGYDGTFGVGGAGASNSSSYNRSSGGGGGWYGGGGAAYHGSSSYHYTGGGGSGGGSGYVYTDGTAANYPSGCLLNSSHYLTDAATIEGRNAGDGRVKITRSKEYSIPVLNGLTTLYVGEGDVVNLTEGITLKCAYGESGCSLVGTDITDTSTLSKGTHTVHYIVQAADGSQYKYPRVINVQQMLDSSGANYPALTENLVPVMHNGTTWVTADVTSSTSEYGWYDYDAKKWANAVLLTSTKRNSLTKDAKGNYTPGQTIGDTETDGVLAFYVWIPRYKYKVWNIDKVVGTDTYNAYTKGIDIVFESGTGKTGGITCAYDFTKTASATVRNEDCTDSGNGYYTHPAFTFGNDELTGFWMGKFEISSDTPSATDGGGNSTTLTPRILPNVVSWRSNPVSNQWKVIKDMQVTNNIYGLDTSTTTVDTHMLTNMEWGAVAYLTHSKYGRCTGGDASTCTEVTINNNSSYKTGYSNSTSNPYTTTNGQLASTTGNIYGVYDMSGGANEYVMGNVSSASGSYTYKASSAGSNYTYSGNEKYLTTYAHGTSNTNQTAYNRGRLGDATGEIVTATGDSGGWYSDYAGFAGSSNPWFRRGGGYGHVNTAGVFDFNYNDGGSSGYSSRGALAVFSA